MSTSKFHRWDGVSDEDRFLAKVAKASADECWPWQGAIKKKGGYGAFQTTENGRRKTWIASRYALGLKLGRALRHNEDACHSCDNPKCCNPSHLFSASHQANMEDKVRKGRNMMAGRILAKLSREDVLEIRRLRSAKVPLSEVADQFSISYSYCSSVACGKVLQHLFEDNNV